MEGEIWLDPQTTAAFLRQFSGSAADGTSSSQEKRQRALSKREREVTALVAEGLGNREIADKLGLREQTVKNHIYHIFDKTNVSDRLELALYAFRQQLVPDSRS